MLSIGTGDVLSRAIGFAVFVYAARILAEGDFGAWNVAAAWTGLLVPIVDFGLGYTGTRSIARDPSSLPDMLTHIVLLRLVLAGGSVVVITLLAFLAGLDQMTVGLVTVCGLSLVVQAFSLSWAYQGTGNAYWFLVEKLTQSILYAGLVVLLFHPPMSVLWFPAFLFLSTSLSVLIVVVGFAVPRIVGDVKVSLRAFFLRHRGTIGPGVLTSLVSNTRLVIDILIVGSLLGTAAAAGFSASFRFYVVLLLIPNLLWSSFYPMLSRAVSDSGPWQSSVRILFTFTWWFCGFLAGVGFQFGSELFAMVYDERYAETAWLFPWMLTGAAIAIPSLVSTRILPAAGEERTMFWISAAALGVHGGVSLILTMHFGVGGTIGGLLVSEILLASGGLLTLRRLSASGLLQSAVRPGLAAVLVFAGVGSAFRMLDISWWTTLGFCGGAYILWFVRDAKELVKELSRVDRVMIGTPDEGPP
ncbi:MAG: oligosaccharide flippase family protein [Bacteroidota bacterium]